MKIIKSKIFNISLKFSSEVQEVTCVICRVGMTKTKYLLSLLIWEILVLSFESGLMFDSSQALRSTDKRLEFSFFFLATK